MVCSCCKCGVLFLEFFNLLIIILLTGLVAAFLPQSCSFMCVIFKTAAFNKVGAYSKGGSVDHI